MTLHLHRAERTDVLADGLAELLATPLADPFAEEVVVVPARGVERWLTQRLSHRLGSGKRGGDGVCAGVRFLTPHSLVGMLLGRDRDDPWDPDRFVWPLLDVVDESLGEEWCATLAAHLGHGVAGDEGLLRRNRRWSVARRLAGLFASYAAQRPQLVTDWREGRDSDGVGGELDGDLGWQAELWRRLVDRVDAPPPDVRHAGTVARLRAGGDDLALPPRLSLFGHTRLPRTEVELLAALGHLRDVHLWLPQASPHLWDELAAVAADGPVRRTADDSVLRVRHPLLASLGRDARELQRSLAGVGVVAESPAGEAARDEGTALGRLQADLRANVEPGSVRPVPGDDSVQVHACHGAARQVDVLREVLVGLLADDPTLEPRDIVVMCPDIETYAPLIQAGFGLADVVPEAQGHPAHRLRVRLADRALSSTNPLLAVAVRLVSLVGSRATATEVLDLLATEPVRERFALDDDDLAQVAQWVDQAGIRWGLDADGRADYRLERFGQNTWRAGLDRVLVGVAMAEDEHRWLGAALPVDDVSSGDIDLVGALGEYVDRLAAAVDALTAARTVADWVRALADGVRSLTAVPVRDAWQLAQFDRELARIADAAAGGSRTELRVADMRALLDRQLGGRPTRANFRTGTLTVCTMVPMRSVPHRVVCLLGLDDGEFPRSGTVDGDDVLARDPVTGERDVRSEDRQLLLDAVLAAGEKLVVTYTGANEQTGAPRPPAVPLGELVDAVGGHVVTRHPLQPFDRRNLEPGLTRDGLAFSFDAAARAGAQAALGTRVEPRPLVEEPLPPRPLGDVALADLQRFLAHPVREFLRTRLDISAPLAAEETHDAIPVELDPLQKWAVGDRLLRDVLDGLDPASSMTAELLRGLLPPAALGQRTLTDVIKEVQALVERTAHLREGTRRTLDVDVDLGNGRRLTGTVSGIVGSRIVSVTYSSLRARQRLQSWVDLLALSAGHPDQSWTASAVGKGRAGPSQALAGPLDHRAVAWLRDLVDTYDRGLREPLPLPLRTGLAYAEGSLRARMGDPKDPLQQARREWETDRDRAAAVPGEQDDPAHVRVHGDDAPLSVLTTVPRADEDFNDEPHRLGRYAWRVWGPLLTGGERVGPL
ncbi:exodeoxyribonuclease V subunit gamma [Nocardioides guangzhouensis]|uniref:RecBCD enzyme subunit RecC n=1 Tax=Nocardioides guangzhouensis TaxID=2497878 RepID=A0A4Q4ZJX8_9ACTN|nr:exodeoxyribonuclease V subunit gamma [Nocardioides guangzhouensis]RYP88623.1 exodeoxyribonuclease V subunit gamma [Nocardioides guangzhouensis]